MTELPARDFYCECGAPIPRGWDRCLTCTHRERLKGADSLARERPFAPPTDRAAYNVRAGSLGGLPVGSLGLLQAMAVSPVPVTFQWDVFAREIFAVTEAGQRFAILAWDRAVCPDPLMNLVNAEYRRLRMAWLEQTDPEGAELDRFRHGPPDDRR